MSLPLTRWPSSRSSFLRGRSNTHRGCRHPAGGNVEPAAGFAFHLKDFADARTPPSRRRGSKGGKKNSFSSPAFESSSGLVYFEPRRSFVSLRAPHPTPQPRRIPLLFLISAQTRTHPCTHSSPLNTSAQSRTRPRLSRRPNPLHHSSVSLCSTVTSLASESQWVGGRGGGVVLFSCLRCDAIVAPLEFWHSISF